MIYEHCPHFRYLKKCWTTGDSQHPDFSFRFHKIFWNTTEISPDRQYVSRRKIKTETMGPEEPQIWESTISVSSLNEPINPTSSCPKLEVKHNGLENVISSVTEHKNEAASTNASQMSWEEREEQIRPCTDRSPQVSDLSPSGFTPNHKNWCQSPQTNFIQSWNEQGKKHQVRKNVFYMLSQCVCSFWLFTGNANVLFNLLICFCESLWFFNLNLHFSNRIITQMKKKCNNTIKLYMKVSYNGYWIWFIFTYLCNYMPLQLMPVIF